MASSTRGHRWSMPIPTSAPMSPRLPISPTEGPHRRPPTSRSRPLPCRWPTSRLQPRAPLRSARPSLPCRCRPPTLPR
ncbi:MAG: hypothetical protein EA397_17470 [Deltaproteobacteria bacterium]|nr:MAG: hypothetical protein EA397_17470 [Deltaproteobacteria bacterium]